MSVPASGALHHVTAIAGPAARNHRFWTGALGLRLVKRTVNFDDPGTWHLYYGDRLGRPGTALTFFPWTYATGGRPGVGETACTEFAVPPGSIEAWRTRLQAAGVSHTPPVERWGRPQLEFLDPDGFVGALVELADEDPDPWAGGPVPADEAVRGFAAVRLRVAESGPTQRILEQVLGYDLVDETDGRLRLKHRSEVRAAEVEIEVVGSGAPPRPGAGSVHHVAFRAADDEAQRTMREQLRSLGLQVTEVLDRNYFRSIYFREPGGVLFEIATDDPGFAIDEPEATLGEELRLPAWYESRRTEIEARLPPLDEADGSEV